MHLDPTAAIFNNIALVQLKLHQNPQAEASASRSIELQSSYKSYIRRAQARFNQGAYLNCVQDCEAAIKIEEGIEARELRIRALDMHKSVNGTRISGGKFKIKQVSSVNKSKASVGSSCQPPVGITPFAAKEPLSKSFIEEIQDTEDLEVIELKSNTEKKRPLIEEIIQDETKVSTEFQSSISRDAEFDPDENVIESHLDSDNYSDACIEITEVDYDSDDEVKGNGYWSDKEKIRNVTGFDSDDE